MHKLIFVLLTFSLFFNSCSSDIEEDIPESGIQQINITETVVSHEKPFAMTVEILSDEAISNTPLHFHLVTKEGDVNETGDSELLDANFTSIFVPKEQYALSAKYITLTQGTNFIEANISIPFTLPAGHYHMAVSIDPNEINGTQKFVNYLYISETALTIEEGDKSLDIELLEASLEDDVLVIDDSNLDETLYIEIRALSTYHELNNTQINACLEFDGSCKPLNIHNQDTIDLSPVATSSSLAITVLAEDKLDIYALLDEQIHQGFIKITLENKSGEDEVDVEDNTLSIPVSIYKKSIGTSSKITRKTDDTQVEFKSFSKSFNVIKRDSQFGIALTSEAKMVFGAENSFARVEGDLSARVLGKDISIASLYTGAIVTYVSFEETGYDIQIAALGKNVFSSSKNLAELAGYTTIENAELNDTEKATLTQEEQTELLQSRQIELNDEGGEDKSALVYGKEFSIEKSVEKEQVIMVSIVPITLKAAITGSIGFDASIELQGILKLHSEMGPTASLAGEASGGVGIAGFSAGVEANFTFIENDFRGESDLEFVFSGDENNLRLKGILSQSVVNTFGGPNGELNLYAEYTEAKICTKKTSICVKWKANLKCKKKKYTKTHYPCGIRKVRPTLTLFKWDSGLSRDIILLEASQTLLNQKLY